MSVKTHKLWNEQAIFWPAFLVISSILVWLLNDILAPFITGLAIAYLLNPLVTKMSGRLPRSLSSIFVLVGFAVIVGSLVAFLSPKIGHQAAEFFANVPQYIGQLQDWANPYINRFLYRLEANGIEDPMSQMKGNSVKTLLEGTKTVIPSLLAGTKTVIGVGTFLVITPVVAFYCMRDWPHLVNKIDQLFPRDNKKTLRSIFAEFDMRLAGFVRGQLLVCICLGTFYSISLTLVGLNYGLAIGAIAGMLSFIPFVGSTFGFVSSVGIALLQFSGFEMTLVVIALFLVGQFIEANFLTPKLVGERTGLHPVWVIFALMAGGKLFGFTGLLLAVPSAALIGVLVRHALSWYQHSYTYLGDTKK
jgi:predicted PurR-regulated permease PerM